MRTKLFGSIAIMASIAAGLAIGRFVNGRLTAKALPVLEVKDANRRLQANPSGDEISTTFTVRNNGHSEIGLLRANTTCGCTVASIDPKVIPPGGYAVVSVKGTPPRAGEKTVQVEVETDSVALKSLILTMTMVGNSPLPYLLTNSGPARFGTIAGPEATEKIWAESLEERGSRPFIEGASCDIDGLEISGGLSREEDEGDGVVRRRYTYQLRFTTSLSHLDRSSDIIFHAAGPRSHPVLSIPVSVRRAERLRIEPPALVASYRRGEITEPVSFSLSIPDASTPIRVAYSHDLPDGRLDIHTVSTADGTLNFEVLAKTEAAEELSGVIDVSVHQGGSKSVLALPVHLIVR